VDLVDRHAVVEVAPRLGEDRLGANVGAETGARRLDQRLHARGIERHAHAAVGDHQHRRRGDRRGALASTLLRAPLAVEHVRARDLVVAAAHQAELDLVLDVLDVERAAARPRAQQPAHDRLGELVDRLAHACRRRALRAVDGEERLHQRDCDLVRLERDDGTVAAQDLVALVGRRGGSGARSGAGRSRSDGGRRGGGSLHGVPLGAPAFCGAGSVWHRSGAAAEASDLAVRGTAKTLRRGFVEAKIRIRDGHYI
jgi:hypothetical protein